MTRGDVLPHFTVTTVDGTSFSYSDIWQRLNLVLVVVPESEAGNQYAAMLTRRRAEFVAMAGTCIITRTALPGLPAPGALVADEWGEIVYILTPGDVAGLPSADALLEWLEFVRQRCPECEGEAR